MSNHDRFIRRTKDKIGRAGIPTFIGAIDWSFNELKGENRKRWSRHLHGVIPEGSTGAYLKALKKRFPKSRDVRKPVYIVPWDDDAQALRYLVKQPTKRRISFIGKRFDKKTGKHRTCRDTDHQPLRSRDRLELLFASRRHRDRGPPVPERCAVYHSQGQGAHICRPAVGGACSRKRWKWQISLWIRTNWPPWLLSTRKNQRTGILPSLAAATSGMANCK